jgi:hypothetical protein
MSIRADKDGQIHFTSDDSDPEIRDHFHIVINNNPCSELYHSRAYCTAVRALMHHGKPVPGWQATAHRLGRMATERGAR